MALRNASEFIIEFIARTREARERRDLTQEDMADLLQIDQGTYKNYETIRTLPHRLIMPFCLATGIDVAWLYTGRQKKQKPAKVAALRKQA